MTDITACSTSDYLSQFFDVNAHKHIDVVCENTIPCDAERLLRRCGHLFPVKMALTLRAQTCWLPSSDTPQRGSDICLRVAPSSSPVMGSVDNHWKLLQSWGRESMKLLMKAGLAFPPFHDQIKTFSCGQNGTKCPLGCPFRGHNVVKCPLECI